MVWVPLPRCLCVRGLQCCRRLHRSLAPPPPSHTHLHTSSQAGLTVDEGVELIRMCVKELGIRFLLNQREFMVKIVDATGTREVAL